MRETFFVFMLCCVVVTTRPLPAADWPQWRGPNRDGIAGDSPPLVEQFGETGPKKVWESEPITGGAYGGYGQVTVAGGRAFVLFHHRYDAPVMERLLTRDALMQLGWVENMPEEMVKLMEAARTSETRTKLTEAQTINQWADQWIKDNEKPDWRRFRPCVKVRLVAGGQAMSLELLAKLQTVADKGFPDQAALDKWFADNGFNDAARTEIMKKVATTRRASDDFVFCLDAAGGKTLWKTQRPGNWMWYPASSSPCVKDGRCYVLGSTAAVTCLDVTDGKVIWESKPLGASVHGHNRSSSVLIVEAMAVVSSETSLSALDADTGKVLWTSKEAVNKEASPVVWRTADRTYLICAGNKKVHGIDVRDGKSVWSVPGGEVGSTPVIRDDVMAFCGGADDVGLTAYKLSPEAPEKLWNVPLKDRYTSPVVYNGYVYAVGGANETYGDKGKGRAVCVELGTGKVAWDELIGKGAELSSPVLADGKLIVVVAPWLYVIKADPGKYQLLGKANLGLAAWTSPAVVDGHVFLRTNKNVVCYDLTRP